MIQAMLKKSTLSQNIAGPVILLIFQNTTLQSIYGINIFNVIPTHLHYWWIESLLNYFTDVYQGISIEFSPPIFSDITTDIEESKSCLK